MKGNLGKIQKDFKEALEFFGEPPTTTTEDFFGTVSKFGKDLQCAIVQNQKRKDEEQKAEQLSIRKAQTLKEKSLRDKEVSQKIEGEFDKIFSQLKNGSLLRQSSVYRLARPSQIVAAKKQ